jgi:hypothetical protein
MDSLTIRRWWRSGDGVVYLLMTGDTMETWLLHMSWNTYRCLAVSTWGSFNEWLPSSTPISLSNIVCMPTMLCTRLFVTYYKRKMLTMMMKLCIMLRQYSSWRHIFGKVFWHSTYCNCLVGCQSSLSGSVPTQRYALEPMPTIRSRVFYHWFP